MALQIVYTDGETGAPYPAAYIQVRGLDFRAKDEGSVQVNVYIFNSKEDRDRTRSPIHQNRFSVTGADRLRYFGDDALRGKNPFNAAYLYLKNVYFPGGLDV